MLRKYLLASVFFGILLACPARSWAQLVTQPVVVKPKPNPGAILAEIKNRASRAKSLDPDNDATDRSAPAVNLLKPHSPVPATDLSLFEKRTGRTEAALNAKGARAAPARTQIEPRTREKGARSTLRPVTPVTPEPSSSVRQRWRAPIVRSPG